MNFERSRLRTFQSWPSNSPVSSKRIAKAGFFYTGHQHEVQCFACGVKISDWNYNDSVMAKHRAKDPGCPFVKNPEASGNVSIENEENYKQVSGRLATFNDWPVSFIVTPESLAKTGFYYLKQGDKVKCAYCNIIVGRWEPGDVAEVEHRRQSPNCPFLARDKPNQSNMINLRALDEDMRDLGVQNHRVPKHPNLATFDSRLLTFASWPRDNPLGPQNLAVAGFFYDGRGDQVRCFHCDGGLLKWTAGDEPWSEHARWFPECHFVMLVKGEQFIEDTIKANPPITSADVFLNHKFYTKAPTKRSKVTNEQVQEFMNSPPAIAALQMGLDSSRVKTAIRHRLESSGYSFSSAESLMEAALDVQFDENNDVDDVWGTPPDSPPVLLSAPSHSVIINRGPQNQGSVSPQGGADDNSTDTEEEASSGSQPVATADPQGGEDREQREREEEARRGEEEREGGVVVEVEESKASGGRENENTNAAVVSSESVLYEDNKNESLEDEVRRLREARLCKICMDKEVGVVLLPCGHLVTCVVCASSLPRCPVCRENIKATVRTFLS
uniref:Death-associated inhibitor of apoptosis 2 n=1 Tax=Cacopsylla melanoneura TaxID=428564 RepID=A0A8D9ECF1_9HEMI